MKKYILLILVLSIFGTKTFADDYDIAVKNADGVTIYYNIKNGTELEVTGGMGYSGAVNIPAFVSHEGIEYCVTSIGDYALSWCVDLTSVTIPNTVTSIGDGAFAGCSGLKKTITIPNSVTSIGEWAFQQCSSLETVTIGCNVKSIGVGAFYQCSGLTSVTIGNSVTSIGMQAFYGCSSLTYVRIPDSVESIGASAFEDCTCLTTVMIGNSVTSIDTGAFQGCSLLTEVISMIELPFNIAPNTFSNYNARLYVPAGTNEDYKGKNGWKNFAAIEANGIAVKNADGVTIYYNYINRTEIEVTYGEDKYSGSVNIPASVNYIGIEYSVTSIGEVAFAFCIGLTSVTIPNSVTSIGHNAFVCCPLASITIPNSVTSLGHGTFQNCSKNTGILL